MLTAALGAVAGAVTTAIGRPTSASAAAGDNLVLGATNFAGSSATRLNATSSGGAFWMTQNGSGSGVRGDSVNGHGGVFTTAHQDRYGLYAQQTAASSGAGAAVQASGNQNDGVYATTDNNGHSAVRAVHNASGYAMWATSSGGNALRAASTTGIGVFVTSNGTALQATSEGPGYGVVGTSINGVGVSASSQNNTGMVASSSGDSGAQGLSSYQYGAGVDGYAYGSSGHGVVGGVNQDTSTASAIYGESAGATSFAGYFVGKVTVTGTLAKGGGSFRIDHPLDPANRILQHSFVESPDMLNLYNGVVTADAAGEATVELPDWFMALNRDFRYSLTPIGVSMPTLHVKDEVANGRFTLAGATPAGRVSWQLTGIRKDAWAEANRIEVELDKSHDQKGRYLHPAEHGQPASKGVDWETHQRLAASRERAKKARP